MSKKDKSKKGKDKKHKTSENTKKSMNKGGKPSAQDETIIEKQSIFLSSPFVLAIILVLATYHYLPHLVPIIQLPYLSAAVDLVTFFSAIGRTK